MSSAAQANAIHADREIEILRVSELRMVAGRTGNITIAGENRIPEQQSAELNFGRCSHVVSGRFNALRQR
jgi:hypothetical protein